MNNMRTIALKLSQFEGPLELLCALVKKEELALSDIEISLIVAQIRQKLDMTLDLDLGAESISQIGNLLWMKSRSLLPEDASKNLVEDEIPELEISFLEQLVDYCRFKTAAQKLALFEEKASLSYIRQQRLPDSIKKPLGIEHLSLSDFASIFQKVIHTLRADKELIAEEEWRISDKMDFIRNQFKNQKKIPFELLFSLHYPKPELIVFFLAVLELMKLGEIRITKKIESDTKNIFSLFLESNG
jgi:segregation and condensation protein A